MNEFFERNETYIKYLGGAISISFIAAFWLNSQFSNINNELHKMNMEFHSDLYKMNIEFNEKFVSLENEFNEKFSSLEKDMAIIKTALIMKNIIPVELAKHDIETPPQ